ncbi:MAG: hypothetical protein ACRBDI_00265 [Alphaproteobacteria bacterium]
MYHKIINFLPIFFAFICIISWIGTSIAQTQDANNTCAPMNRTCILEDIQTETAKIKNQSWKDQTYRELAKTYAFDGYFDKAIGIIPLIQTPDTKAMTIRGIGMTIAAQEHNNESHHNMFTTLRVQAEKIEHPASYAIALTYIAMAQAFAGDNEGAWKTAAAMENDALRHKAYGETAEIQAEKSDFKSARISIQKIESEAYRNKAYSIVSGLLADNALYEDAYSAAISITNPYKKASALQYILDAEKPRDVKH